MAIGHTPGGTGHVVPNDPNHPVVTPQDTVSIAYTVDARFREQGAKADAALRAAEAVMGMAGIGASSPIDSQTAALVRTKSTLTHDAVRSVVQEVGVQARPLGLHAEDLGVKGNGIADDTDAFHAAASAAATLGVPLVIPAGFSIGISSYKRLPEGLTMHTNGSSFQQLTAMGRAPVVGLGPRSTVVGGLRVQTLGGDACQGVLIADAPDCNIDSVDVRSSTPGAGKGNIRDNGLRIINSPGVRIGRVFVENYSWPVWAELSDWLEFGWIEASGYAKAVHLDGCSRVRIHGGHVYGTAPNSQYAPGYNGLLMEADISTVGIHVQNFMVEDAGEHGVRLSGPAVQREVYFQNCVTRNVGGTGFKVLGSLVADRRYNTGVTFDNCKAIDSGSINQNCCGFLIQMAQHVTLINPEVRKLDKDYSAVEGIRLGGVMHVTVVSPKIMDTNKFAVHLDEACGNVQDVTFTDTHIQTETGHGIYLQNPGVEFRDIRFKGGLVEVWGTDPNSAGTGFYAGRYTAPEDSGTWRGMNELEITFSDSTAASRQVSEWSSPTALDSFMADITMWRAADAAPSWPPFSGGSMILDRRRRTRQVMKGDVWVGL